jgi:hypothetical protein
MLIYDPNSNISEHFKMYEVMQSSVASRNNIDNIPTSPILEAATLTAKKVLEPIRNYFGIPFSPNSWYRGELLEKFINEIPYKQWCNRKGLSVNKDSWQQYFVLKSHPRGEAVDIKIPGIKNDDLLKWIADNIEYDQLIREFPKPNDPHSGWVHVSFSSTHNRHELFTIV